jgi:hypothetical protein
MYELGNPFELQSRNSFSLKKKRAKDAKKRFSKLGQALHKHIKSKLYALCVVFIKNKFFFCFYNKKKA